MGRRHCQKYNHSIPKFEKQRTLRQNKLNKQHNFGKFQNIPIIQATDA